MPSSRWRCPVGKGLGFLALAAAAVGAAVLPAPAFQGRARARLCDLTLSTYSTSDVEMEVRLGRDTAATLLARLPLVADPVLQRYVALVGQSLARYAPRSELSYRFAVVEAPDVNAYSTPGGYVFVTRGAIAAMANEAELAGVLGHELAHVGARHVVESLGLRAGDQGVRAGLVGFLRSGADSLSVAVEQAVSGTVNLLFATGYRIEEEQEADQGAVCIAGAAGYAPDALAGLLERLQRQGAGAAPDGRVAYPTPASRIDAIAALAREDSGGGGMVLAERFAARGQVGERP